MLELQGSKRKSCCMRILNLFGFQWAAALRVEVGGIDAEGPPVPIPNTEVKLCRAEDTQLETARENRYMPTRTEVRLCKSNLCLLNIPP